MKGPKLDARAWALIDARTGAVLASHAAHRSLPIASTTKMMTAYVALHDLPLDKVVRAVPYHPIYGESLLGLRTGQRISVGDLLYGLILRSGNDAAHNLAVAAAGSDARFVREMNRHAAALGLSDTHYANPVGLDEKGNHSSAYDLTVLGRRLLQNRAFAKIADSRTAVLRSVHPKRRIETIDDFLLEVPWATGIKTGHTFAAEYCLVGAGRRKGVDLISAVLGVWTESGRDLDTRRLLEYGFSLYRERHPVRAGQVLSRAEVRYQDGRLPLRAARSVKVGVRRGQRAMVAVRAPQEVEGPVRRGAALGTATVSVGGMQVAKVPLRAGRAVAEATTLDRARSFIADNALWLALALSAILVAAVFLRRRTR
ncbi:MAG TPA: D-alanyl-D-alanine carboxypeptidase family protein [Solirubrobacterales bacterium]|jgi:D-alanyl-D-alanine carboxypeptidase (penicillin-binding protein 5/6)